MRRCGVVKGREGGAGLGGAYVSECAQPCARCRVPASPPRHRRLRGSTGPAQTCWGSFKERSVLNSKPRACSAPAPAPAPASGLACCRPEPGCVLPRSLRALCAACVWRVRRTSSLKSAAKLDTCGDMQQAPQAQSAAGRRGRGGRRVERSGGASRPPRLARHDALDGALCRLQSVVRGLIVQPAEAGKAASGRARGAATKQKQTRSQVSCPRVRVFMAVCGVRCAVCGVRCAVCGCGCVRTPACAAVARCWRSSARRAGCAAPPP